MKYFRVDLLANSRVLRIPSTPNLRLKRKLTEFGYYENGVLVKPYIVPTADNIHLWIKPRGDENE